MGVEYVAVALYGFPIKVPASEDPNDFMESLNYQGNEGFLVAGAIDADPVAFVVLGSYAEIDMNYDERMFKRVVVMDNYGFVLDQATNFKERNNVELLDEPGVYLTGYVG